jgi:hypothetical protein
VTAGSPAPTVIVRFYHRTPHAAAILNGGFRDGAGSYGAPGAALRGVFVSDPVPGVSDGASRDNVLEIRLPRGLDGYAEHELVQEHGSREWVSQPIC